jgi:hypothetical protein
MDEKSLNLGGVILPLEVAASVALSDSVSNYSKLSA